MLKLFIVLPPEEDGAFIEALEERAEEFFRDPQKMVCVLPPGAYIHEFRVGEDEEVQVEVEDGE